MVKKAKAVNEAEQLTKFMQLLRHPNRIEVKPDGWFWDKLCGVDRAPLEMIKHLNAEEGAAYAAEIGDRLADDFELITLIDHSKECPAIIEPFKKVPYNDWYWTRTPCGKSSLWCVDFYYGPVYLYHKASYNYVWPVRSSQCQLDYLPVR